MIIGLMGYAREGKDSVADVLVKDFGFTRIAFADKLKEMALLIDPPCPQGTPMSLKQTVEFEGWESAKEYPDHRMFLQNLGVAARECLHPDVWIQAAFDDVSLMKDVVIPDVRFLNEIKFVLSHFDGHLLRVERPGHGPVNGHVSEHEWTSQAPEYTIHNDGDLDQLRRMTHAVYRAMTDYRS